MKSELPASGCSISSTGDRLEQRVSQLDFDVLELADLAACKHAELQADLETCQSRLQSDLQKLGDECHQNLGRLHECLDSVNLCVNPATRQLQERLEGMSLRLAEMESSGFSDSTRTELPADIHATMLGALQAAITPLAEHVAAKLISFERELMALRPNDEDG